MVPQITEWCGRNEKTVRTWRNYGTVEDSPMGSKKPGPTVPQAEAEAARITFLRHTLPPLDNCLYTLQDSVLHHLNQQNRLSGPPDLKGKAEPKETFRSYPIGYFNINVAKVRMDEGKS